MSNDFVYTTYIKTTPEKVWQAITNPEFTRQYWGGMDNISDWKKGSDWQHTDGKDTRIIGKVLESNPPTRLVVSWASPNDPNDVSQVSYDISAIEDMVRLDVIHTALSDEMGKAVSNGWPRVLSSLKSFLETGKALDGMACKNKECA